MQNASLSFDIKSKEISQLLDNNVNRVILKPTIDSCSGHGVLLFSRKDGVYVSNNGDVLDGQFLKSYSDDFVVQEALVQHPDLARFNPSSVNSLRICTYRSVLNEEINVTGALIRIGRAGQIVDNAHAGGRFVGIDIESGVLQHIAHDQYGGNYTCWNAADFENNTYVIPQWDRVKTFAIEIAKCNKHSRLLALDITVDEKSNPRLIEINIEGFAFWVFMFCGQDIFIGQTQSVIDYCKMKMLKDGRNKLV